MAGNFLISKKNVPSAFKKLELQRQWSAISTRGRGPGEPHLKTHARDTSLLPGGGGLGASIPENFGNLEAWKWYFQCSLKKTQPGYGVKRQVLLVLTACTCTPPPQKRKCREG